MAKGTKNNNGNIMNQLVADKQKVVMALCLVSVMVFMWVRVLSGKGTNSAEAAAKKNQLSSQQNSEIKISFVELPKVTGRNDVLSRDLFTQGKGRLSSSKNNNEKINLEAILSGEQEQAFINDRLLVAGDKFAVSEDGGEKEYEVIEITQNTVLLKCGETEITLRLE
ncbi:MAG: hypothetical protein KAI59_01290 [Planctomycetes bacterium]|nr:hypothetical protein [Planctomycetota bacterium]MCK5472639.1 hypothetical protein [Planctomycetota bacterium]